MKIPLLTALAQRFYKLRQTDRVMGLRIQEPRPTWLAACWVLIYLALPVWLLGTLVDLLIQAISGYCSGFWCYF
jgi:hypothetical protein